MKKLEIRINKFAQNDIIDSVDFYNGSQAGLGYDLWKEIKHKLKIIENNPLQFQIIVDKTRRANIKRFPLGIFYIINDYFIDVFAVIHYSRSPKIWKKRIDEKK